jgi:hypothetical protein
MGMTELTSEIQQRGHWDVAIHPTRFVLGRVPYDQLDEVVPSVAVRMRGWPVPYANPGRREILRGEDWVGQDVDARGLGHVEAWRLFTSGQFSHLRGINADWRANPDPPLIPAGPASFIEVWEVLFYVTEVFELAARLALGPAGDEEMTIAIDLEGIGQRDLVVGQENRAEFMTPYRSHASSISLEVRMPREDLVADGRAAAARMARDFFVRFGWKPSHDQLVDHQRELTERGR